MAGSGGGNVELRANVGNSYPSNDCPSYSEATSHARESSHEPRQARREGQDRDLYATNHQSSRHDDPFGYDPAATGDESPPSYDSIMATAPTIPGNERYSNPGMLIVIEAREVKARLFGCITATNDFTDCIFLLPSMTLRDLRTALAEKVAAHHPPAPTSVEPPARKFCMTVEAGWGPLTFLLRSKHRQRVTLQDWPHILSVLLGQGKRCLKVRYWFE